MKFKKGDKVRFLNTKGGGTVIREINSFMVSVAIEDGFEIPTLISDLVLIESMGTSGNMFLEEDEIGTQQSREQSAEEQDRISDLQIRSAGIMVPSGIYLAWCPRNQRQLLVGNMDIVLINNTANDILYSFFLKDTDAKFSGIDYGSVPPKSKIIIESIVREDMAMWSSGIVQILFYQEEIEKVLIPVSTNFRIKGSVFYTEGSYKETSLLTGQKAIIYTICELNRVPGTAEQILNQKESLEPLPASAERFRPETGIDKYRIATHEAEVDLHISSLRERYQDLSAHEILSIQLGHFERMLESAIALGYTHVVFIHGIGNGSLKHAIIDRLNQYNDIEFRNASFAKYGNGAIELVLHGNR